MKYLLVLMVVGVGLWMLVRRLRGGGDTATRPNAARAEAKPPASPTVMVRCAQCGLHLASVDAVPEGSRLYCSEAHRRLGPGPAP